MLSKVFSSLNPICDVVRDSETSQMYLVSLCAGIAWSHVGIVMNDEEITAFQADPHSAEAMSRKMCFSFSSFEGREIPESLRAKILATIST